VRRIALIGVLIVIGVWVATWLFVRWRLADPAINIPTPTMPSPNAFDYYVAAGKLLVDVDKVQDAVDEGEQWEYLPAAKEALLAANAAAVEKWREGLQYEYGEPPIRSYEQTMPYFADFRDLARVLRLKAQVQGEKGDWAGAMTTQLDVMAFCADITHGSMLIGTLVSTACQAPLRSDMRQAMEHLNAEQARAAARRLAAISGAQAPMAAVMTEDKWATLACLVEFMDKPSRGDLVRYLVWSKQRIVDDCTFYLNQVIAMVGKPYARPGPLPEYPEAELRGEMLMGPDVIRSTQCGYEVNRSRNGLLVAELALRAWRLEHGEHPRSLHQLVPDYLDEVPQDPFAINAGLRYERTGPDEYLLYSIGPDCKDDGGKPIENANVGEACRYRVREDSLGDIVAGVNMG
jgi:hypothetical protein